MISVIASGPLMWTKVFTDTPTMQILPLIELLTNVTNNFDVCQIYLVQTEEIVKNIFTFALSSSVLPAGDGDCEGSAHRWCSSLTWVSGIQVLLVRVYLCSQWGSDRQWSCSDYLTHAGHLRPSYTCVLRARVCLNNVYSDAARYVPRVSTSNCMELNVSREMNIAVESHHHLYRQ